MNQILTRDVLQNTKYLSSAANYCHWPTSFVLRMLEDPCNLGLQLSMEFCERITIYLSPLFSAARYVHCGHDNGGIYRLG